MQVSDSSAASGATSVWRFSAATQGNASSDWARPGNAAATAISTSTANPAERHLFIISSSISRFGLAAFKGEGMLPVNHITFAAVNGIQALMTR